MSDESTDLRGAPLSLLRSETRAKAHLTVSSSTFHGPIPERQTEYADGISPQISWTRIEGAKSYALILEDPDAHKIKPFVHWVAYNIPADVTSLPEGLHKQARPSHVEGMLQGKTSQGSVGYFGPRPPVGDPPHHYHFQVFALDTALNVPAGAERDAVLAAMQGHVLAAGEFVGTYQQTTSPAQ